MATFSDIYNPADFDLSDVSESKPLVEVLGGDDESSDAVMRLIESVEHYNAYVRSPDQAFLPTLSLEMLDGERKAGLIAQIVDWLRQLMKTLFDEMTGLEQMARWVSLRASYLKENLHTRSTNYASASSSFKMTTHINNLCVRFRPATDINALSSSLRTLIQVATTYYQYKPLDKLTDVLHAVQASRDPDRLRAVLMQVSPQALIQSKAFIAHPEVDGWFASPHLLGNQRVVIKQRHGNDPDKRLSTTTVRLVASDSNPHELPSELDFLRFSTVQTDQTLNTIKAMADQLLAVNTLNVRTQRSHALDQLGRALKKLDVDSTMSASEPQAVAQIGLTAALVEHYIDWIANPYNGLYGLTCRNLRAALKVCELNAQ